MTHSLRCSITTFRGLTRHVSRAIPSPLMRTHPLPYNGGLTSWQPVVFSRQITTTVPVWCYQKQRFLKNRRTFVKDQFADNEKDWNRTRKPGSADSVERFMHVFSSFRDEELNELVTKLRDEGDSLQYDWQHFQTIMENSSNQRLRKHWHSMMMTLMLQLNFHHMATSLYDFVVIHEKDSPHLAFLSSYISLQASVNNEKEILRAYDSVNTKLLDVESVTRIIRGLSLTARWRECLHLLELSRVTAKDSMTRNGPVIVAAVRNGDFELALNLLGYSCHGNLAPSASVYDVFAEHADEQVMWRFLDLVGEYRYFMKEGEALNLKKWFEKNDFQARRTRVDRKGVCKQCGHTLRRTSLTDSEFMTLKGNFLKKSMIRGDVFLSTTPNELNKFQQFLDRNATFDVIIDALNVAHTGRHWDMKVVLKTVELFMRRNKNVLVVSRLHTASDRFMRQLKCPVFYTSDLSKDDPFVLYAALYSGSACHVVTRDEMRDHCFLLGDVDAPIFRKWQRGRQVMVSGLRADGSPVLNFPPSHEVTPQRVTGVTEVTADTWHVPYDDMDERASFALPETWLCAKKKR